MLSCLYLDQISCIKCCRRSPLVFPQSQLSLILIFPPQIIIIKMVREILILMSGMVSLEIIMICKEGALSHLWRIHRSCRQVTEPEITLSSSHFSYSLFIFIFFRADNSRSKSCRMSIWALSGQFLELME